jgi:hypothetical protein
MTKKINLITQLPANGWLAIITITSVLFLASDEQLNELQKLQNRMMRDYYQNVVVVLQLN